MPEAIAKHLLCTRHFIWTTAFHLYEISISQRANLSDVPYCSQLQLSIGGIGLQHGSLILESVSLTSLPSACLVEESEQLTWVGVFLCKPRTLGSGKCLQVPHLGPFEWGLQGRWARDRCY